VYAQTPVAAGFRCISIPFVMLFWLHDPKRAKFQEIPVAKSPAQWTGEQLFTSGFLFENSESKESLEFLSQDLRKNVAHHGARCRAEQNAKRNLPAAISLYKSLNNFSVSCQ
jgi:hypothetical protein